MSASWIAGSVRARLLLERRAGPERALSISRADSLREAMGLLAGTIYAPRTLVESLEDAQRGVAAGAAIQLRVLAAWLPQGGTVGLRALAAWFELVNIEDRLAYLAGGELRPPFELGVLSSVWEAVREAQSVEEVRAALAGSSWGDPGSDDPREIGLALRLAWARRVGAQAPEAQLWAAGAVAILVAEELLVAEARTASLLAGRSALDVASAGARTVADLRGELPAGSWALAGVDDPSELWKAELRWWRMVEADAERMVRGRLNSRDVVVGTVALYALDAIRVTTALAAAARGSDATREVLDALC
jgi:hypothetical protein